MIGIASRIYRKYKAWKAANARMKRIRAYHDNGRIPWSEGYNEAKKDAITANINSPEVLRSFTARKLPPGYGTGIDERIVEYPWLVSQLSDKACRLLDAGSTFNFEHIVSHPKIAKKELVIYTYYPENENHAARRISYVYGDLRELPFRDQWFDEIVCQSTLEHIDMDNSMYGYQLESKGKQERSYEYLGVIRELKRVLKPGGTILLTFPYGKYEEHGFFQQFDREMVSRMTEVLENSSLDFILYSPQGWQFASQEQCDSAESFNPHTGKGKKNDNAAHSRAVCCIKYGKP